MNSIRTKFTLLNLCTILVAISIAAAIGVISIRNLGRDDADQLLHLTAETGAKNLDAYFESVQHSVETVAALVHDSFEASSPIIFGSIRRSQIPLRASGMSIRRAAAFRSTR